MSKKSAMIVACSFLFGPIVFGLVAMVVTGCDGGSRRIEPTEQAARYVSTHRRLSVEEVDGHEYVLYARFDYGAALVHHEGCHCMVKEAKEASKHPHNASAGRS